MHNTLVHYDLKRCRKVDSELNYQSSDIRIKSHFRDKQNTHLIQADKTRCKRAYKQEAASYCPTKEEPAGAIVHLLNQELLLDLHYDNSYIPEPIRMQAEDNQPTGTYQDTVNIAIETTWSALNYTKYWNAMKTKKNEDTFRTLSWQS